MKNIHYFHILIIAFILMTLFNNAAYAKEEHLRQAQPSNPTIQATTTLRIRSAPSINASQIGTLSTGATRTVIGKNANGLWLQISHEGQRGWVCAEYTINNGLLNQVSVTDQSSEDCAGNIAASNYFLEPHLSDSDQHVETVESSGQSGWPPPSLFALTCESLKLSFSGLTELRQVYAEVINSTTDADTEQWIRLAEQHINPTSGNVDMVLDFPQQPNDAVLLVRVYGSRFEVPSTIGGYPIIFSWRDTCSSTGEATADEFMIEESCFYANTPRAEIGDNATITRSSNVLVEPLLSSTSAASVGVGQVVRVLRGPVCTDGRYWYQVGFGGPTGWLVESEGRNYIVDVGYAGHNTPSGYSSSHQRVNLIGWWGRESTSPDRPGSPSDAYLIFLADGRFFERTPDGLLEGTYQYRNGKAYIRITRNPISGQQLGYDLVYSVGVFGSIMSIHDHEAWQSYNRVYPAEFTNDPNVTIGFQEVIGAPEVNEPLISPQSPDCTVSNLRVLNPFFAAETVEAVFCEGEVPGQGSLWLHSNSTIAHLVKVRPDPGVDNIEPVVGFIWGPDYWFLIASDVRLDPGERIRIHATRFGDTREENFAALQVHTALIAELFFIGNTPHPGEGSGRYWILLAEQIPFLNIGTYAGILNTCNTAIEDGTRLDLAKCILSLAQEDSILENIRQILQNVNIERSIEELGLIFRAISRIVEIGSNLGEVGSYLLELSNATQDDYHWVIFPP